MGNNDIINFLRYAWLSYLFLTIIKLYSRSRRLYNIYYKLE